MGRSTWREGEGKGEGKSPRGQERNTQEARVRGKKGRRRQSAPFIVGQAYLAVAR